MKEHKNPKVLSEGILWMVSAVEDFGVSHLKLKVAFLFKFLLFILCTSIFLALIFINFYDKLVYNHSSAGFN